MKTIATDITGWLLIGISITTAAEDWSYWARLAFAFGGALLIKLASAETMREKIQALIKERISFVDTLEETLKRRG